MSGGYFSKYHIFRDPIHGYIKVYDTERDLINTPAFQRLRRIKQLGPTNLIYHGADHTRFSHSLGVMELATRVFDIVVAKDQEENLLQWKDDVAERKRILLRLVALLHDIGHAPLSHTGEKELFPENLTHKDFSRRVVEENEEIRDIIDNDLKDKFDITPENIGNFITKEEPYPILQQIIDGPLDVDRMDYLWRDSYYTGVHYGRFDLDRLTNTLVIVFDKVDESPSLGVEEGGVYTVEALTFARYYMFLQVYFHAVRRAYDLHYTQFIKTILADSNDKYPPNLDEYLKLDDNTIGQKIQEEVYSGGENKELAEILLHRRHHECIRETSDYTNDIEKKIFERNVGKIKDKFGDRFLTDNAQDAPNKFRKEQFYAKLRSPKSNQLKDKYKEINKISEIIKSLEAINKYRLYAPRSNELEAMKSHVSESDWES